MRLLQKTIGIIFLFFLSIGSTAFAQQTTADFYTSAQVLEDASSGYTMHIHVGNRGTAVQNAIVDIEVKNEAGEKVTQWFFEGQQFDTESSEIYTVNWNPEESDQTYHIAIGVFAENWSHLYTWNEPAATISEEGDLVHPSDEGTCGRPGTSNFNACYYDDKNWTEFKLNRTDDVINFNWAHDSPHSLIMPDTFSAKWWGLFEFEEGEYEFTVTSDDGFRLIVDNEVILDKMFDQAATTYTVRKRLSAGQRGVIAEYYENSGEAVAKLSWRKIPADNPPPEETGETDFIVLEHHEKNADNSRFTAHFKNTSNSPVSRLLDIELINSNNQKVAQHFEEVTLSGNETATISLETPSNLPSGSYYWSVGIFTPGWGELVSWHHALESFAR